MIAGVDYDTRRVALCLLEWDESEPWFRTFEYRGKEDAWAAIGQLVSGMNMLLMDKAPRRHETIARAVDVWWIEHAFGRGPTDFKLGRVQGAIAASVAAKCDAPMNEVGPSEWKKGLGLPGNAKKEVYVPTLRARCGADDATEHEVDAYGIAEFGRLANLKAASR